MSGARGLAKSAHSAIREQATRRNGRRGEARRTQRCVGGSAALQRADYDTAAYVGIACVQLIPRGKQWEERVGGGVRRGKRGEEEGGKNRARSVFYLFLSPGARARRDISRRQ